MFKNTLALIAASMSFAANAHFIDGNLLLTYMVSPIEVERTFVMGFVSGVADIAPKDLVCVPDKVEIKQLVASSKEYLISNPSSRHEPAAMLVATSLMNSWSCKEKPTTPKSIGML